METRSGASGDLRVIHTTHIQNIVWTDMIVLHFNKRIYVWTYTLHSLGGTLPRFLGSNYREWFSIKKIISAYSVFY